MLLFVVVCSSCVLMLLVDTPGCGLLFVVVGVGVVVVVVTVCC